VKSGLDFPLAFGDVVSLWDGLHVPMVIRASSNDADQEVRRTLVSPTYMDGLMFGEAIPENSNLEDLVIV
jgi:hypothetical protein